MADSSSENSSEANAPAPPIPSTPTPRARIRDVLVPAPQPAASAPPSSKDPEDPVNILLKLMERPSGWCPDAEVQFSGSDPQGRPFPKTRPADVYLQLAGGGRATYTLAACETLSDIAREYYGAADIANLIYQLNHQHFDAQFSRGLKMRLKMVPGTTLQLPSTREATDYLARGSPTRHRTIEYDIC